MAVMSAPVLAVSTHSRPKAAGKSYRQSIKTGCCFNTQPPEGGWLFFNPFDISISGFNTQPPEGGWICRAIADAIAMVSTHSRPKAAG